MALPICPVFIGPEKPDFARISPKSAFAGPVTRKFMKKLIPGSRIRAQSLRERHYLHGNAVFAFSAATLHNLDRSLSVNAAKGPPGKKREGILFKSREK
jgi:hypothetical protein